MSTIHNPVNFKPEDYAVVGYFDNRPPEYYGNDGYAAALAQWQADRQRLFPNGQNVHRCAHCGNGTVRYVAACRHAPTGQNVVFGDVCVERLGFENHNKFAAELIRSRAAAAAKAAKIFAAREEFLSTRPALAAIVKEVEAGQHTNWFVRDVVGKLAQYGSLSDRQVAAVIGAVESDRRRARQQADRQASCEKAMAAGVKAPSGRQTVRGKVLNVQLREGQFGPRRKMLVELSDSVRVWSSVPASVTLDDSGLRGRHIRLTATFSPKAGELFAFASRPLVALESEEAEHLVLAADTEEI